MTGLPWSNGQSGSFPVPFGLAIADMMAGAHLVQGLLACLVRRGITRNGGLVEVSLLESTLDVQLNVLSDYLNANQGKANNNPFQADETNASASGSLYTDINGIYATSDGNIALSCTASQLDELLVASPQSFKAYLQSQTTAELLHFFNSKDILCSNVLTWPELLQEEGFQQLGMLQEVVRAGGARLMTLGCPLRIDGTRFNSAIGSPTIGEHNAKILQELRGDNHVNQDHLV